MTTNVSPLVDKWFRMWNGDLALVEDVATPDIRVHATKLDGGELPLVGREELTGWVGGARSAFTTLDYALEVGPVVEDDLVAMRWSAAGVYGGGIPGAAAERGAKVAFTGMDILRVVDGKFAEYWINSDLHVMLAQLKISA
ncbi:ester cyclase [Saccharothrix coeruleofusca]|uniref:SnoaL-like polyketide cyclase n=1 Tax=Saccharothrix coeruleofusca TaxID=33919 RepID=A0A918ATC1_9PSEU|nr:ester cyclase [Saccharothrix coeruleofusca]MBP2339671.1 hypothetical protein [Saccharothrix coeruleofusca]GGP80948.1 hypothetical protein GCM10010185_63630 [Saccharothrix coeruleofusca]